MTSLTSICYLVLVLLTFSPIGLYRSSDWFIASTRCRSNSMQWPSLLSGYDSKDRRALGTLFQVSHLIEFAETTGFEPVRRFWRLMT